MPTYEYACRSCGEHLEIVQSFSDAPLTECPACQGELRKVFSPIGISFKGSGFYKTDSRSSSGSTKKSEGGDTAGSGSGSGSSGGKDAGSSSSSSSSGGSKDSGSSSSSSSGTSSASSSGSGSGSSGAGSAAAS